MEKRSKAKKQEKGKGNRKKVRETLNKASKTEKEQRKTLKTEEKIYG